MHSLGVLFLVLFKKNNLNKPFVFVDNASLLFSHLQKLQLDYRCAKCIMKF